MASSKKQKQTEHAAKYRRSLCSLASGDADLRDSPAKMRGCSVGAFALQSFVRFRSFMPEIFAEKLAIFLLIPSAPLSESPENIIQMISLRIQRILYLYFSNF